MTLKRVKFVNGDVGEVGEEWIARWPEDIERVLDDDEPVVKKSRSGAPKRRASTGKKSAGSQPPEKPAPEVPETHVGTGDAQKDEAP